MCIRDRCDNCEAGKHKASAGVNLACDNCEAGKHKADAGINLACDNCQAGKHKAAAGINVSSEFYSALDDAVRCMIDAAEARAAERGRERQGLAG